MACSPYTSQTWRWMSAGFYISCNQETDYRAHFTCGGLLDFLEHCKHTGQCVNAVRLSAYRIRAFPKDQQTLPTSRMQVRSATTWASLFSHSILLLMVMVVRNVTCSKHPPLCTSRMQVRSATAWASLFNHSILLLMVMVVRNVNCSKHGLDIILSESSRSPKRAKSSISVVSGYVFIMT
jgi:hypothetical protein